MLSQHPLSLDPDFCYPFNERNYFSVCNWIVLPNIVCFCKFAFRLLKISIAEQKIYSQSRAENQTQHPIKKVPKRHPQSQDCTHASTLCCTNAPAVCVCSGTCTLRLAHERSWAPPERVIMNSRCEYGVLLWCKEAVLLAQCQCTCVVRWKTQVPRAQWSVKPIYGLDCLDRASFDGLSKCKGN